MSIRGGYRPHILRVDLHQGTIVKEPLPSEEVLRTYIGGTGLGLYYLLKEAPPRAHASPASVWPRPWVGKTSASRRRWWWASGLRT